MTDRALLAEVLRDVLADIHAAKLTASALAYGAEDDALRIRGAVLPLRDFDRVVLFGAGKASVAMAAACEALLGARLSRGLVVTTEGNGTALAHADVWAGGHPVPDADSLRAGEEMLQRASALGPRDLCIFLLSGGASAACEALRPGVTLEELQRRTRELLASGAPIEEVNAVRRGLSRFKAGGFAAATSARIVTLALSDVASNDPHTIGSGPTVRLGPANGDYFVVGDAETLARAAEHRLRARGLAAVLGPRLVGEAADVGRAFARGVAPGACLVCVGETTVTLSARAGRGGRNQEMALAFAIAAGGTASAASGGAGLTLAAIGTDGRDGPTDAAGAIVDGTTVARGGAGAEHALATHDSYTYLDGAGDLVRTGPTGTNLADLVICLRR